MTVQLRVWRWPELPVYNGFTHAERVRGWQLIWWLVDTGRLPSAQVCCITGSKASVSYHCENYYDWRPYPLAQSVHLALHQRFKRPLVWQAIVAEHATAKNEWSAQLALEPRDLAGQLRATHGDDIAQVFKRWKTVHINKAPVV